MNNKPKVIQYISFLSGSGGGSYVLAAIAEELAAHDYKTAVVVGTPVDFSKQYSRKLKKNGVPIIGINDKYAKAAVFFLSIPVYLLSILLLLPYMLIKRKEIVTAWKKIFAELSYYLRGRIIVKWVAATTIKNFENMLKNGRFILHVHYLGWPKCIAVLKWAKERKITTLLHFHTDVSFSQIKANQTFFLHLKDFLPEKSAIIVLSQGIKKRMVEQMGGVYSVEVVPNWVKDEGEIQMTQLTAGGPFRICAVARMVGGKGLEDIIRTLVYLSEENMDVTATIIGSGPGRGYLVDMAARLGVADRMLFVGELTENEVIEELRNTHVFVLPSSTEGLSIVLLKAMALGLPVIVTPVGANREIVEQAGNGLLVEIGAVRQLSEAVKKMSADSGLRGLMGVQSRAYYGAHFTSKIVWPMLEKVYKQIL